jgi:hypothetical protein
VSTPIAGSAPAKLVSWRAGLRAELHRHHEDDREEHDEQDTGEPDEVADP